MLAKSSRYTHGLQAIEVSGVKGTSDATGRRDETLQHEGDTECVETLTDEVIDRRRTGPGVISTENTLRT
jgi:hypothetical protein